MTPETYRRKLQKKAKRKRFTKCSACGWRLKARVCNIEDWPWYIVQKRCENLKCRMVKIFGWTGDGNGRRIPHE